MVAEFKRLGLVHEERVIQYLRSLPLKIALISQDQGESVAQIHTAQALLDSSNQIILGAYIGGDCEAYLQEKLQDQSLRIHHSRRICLHFTAYWLLTFFVEGRVST